MAEYTLHQGDCLEYMRTLPDGCFDAVVTDPPYGITENARDKRVDIGEVFRLAPAVIVFSQQPYTSELVVAHIGAFSHEIIWDKVLKTGHLNARRMPLKMHENILVFGKYTYTPQKTVGIQPHDARPGRRNAGINYRDAITKTNNNMEFGTLKYPASIQRFQKPANPTNEHPTQKPIALMVWLLQNYTRPGDTIFDPFMGSGTTGVACMQLGRNFVGVEIDESYFKIAEKRIREAALQPPLFADTPPAPKPEQAGMFAPADPLPDAAAGAKVG